MPPFRQEIEEIAQTKGYILIEMSDTPATGAREMVRERSGNTLETTAPVHEACFDPAGGEGLQAASRAPIGAEDHRAELLFLTEALWDLKHLDARPARGAELRYCGGSTGKEVAQALRVSFATVRRGQEWARYPRFYDRRGMGTGREASRYVAGNAPPRS